MTFEQNPDLPPPIGEVFDRNKARNSKNQEVSPGRVCNLSAFPEPLTQFQNPLRIFSEPSR